MTDFLVVLLYSMVGYFLGLLLIRGIEFSFDCKYHDKLHKKDCGDAS